MKCPECESNERHYNELLGETCCVVCGLVLSWNPIEEFSVIKVPDNHTFEKFQINNLRNAKVFHTNQGLGSHIFATDKTSKRLAWTQLRASTSYRGGVSRADKHMMVLIRNHLHQYGFTLAQNADDLIKSTMRLKARLSGKNKLRGYSVEVRASVLLYLILQQDKLTNLTRHSKITGVSKKKLSKLSRRFARWMEMPQLFSAIDNRKLIGDTLDLIKTNGIHIDDGFRYDCVRTSDYIAVELDKRDLPYKNSTNSAIIWMVSMIRNEGILQSDICAVNESSSQTIRACLRLVLYPMFNFDRKSMKEMTVDDFVSGIRTEEYEQRNKNEI